MKKIAIFASGSGTNAEKIMEHFKISTSVKVACIVTNNKNAGVLERAKAFSVATRIIDKPTFKKAKSFAKSLKADGIDFIVLAGFLWLIPASLIQAYPNKIINLHPSLLPKYGGKGMYGMNVHKAVCDAKEKESGITIHYVNEKYDEGMVVFQKKFPVTKNDNPETIAAKGRGLEHKHFPVVVEGLILEQ